jgi:hypothetical protein
MGWKAGTDGDKEWSDTQKRETGRLAGPDSRDFGDQS